GSGLSCPRCRQDGFRQRSARVAARGPHDFAVRFPRFVRAICTALTQQASIATRATLRDDRASSLVAARAEAVDTANRNSGKEKYVRSGG
ncbi:hypothetical protein, partial [Escherichia coli]|uniref:hypothetical protein n=1 Tax=Escherichia coli TaxID=562 RepID=UPI001BE43928